MATKKKSWLADKVRRRAFSHRFGPYIALVADAIVQFSGYEIEAIRWLKEAIKCIVQ